VPPINKNFCSPSSQEFTYLSHGQIKHAYGFQHAVIKNCDAKFPGNPRAQKFWCGNMDVIYHNVQTIEHGTARACANSPQPKVCVQQWLCYWNGGQSHDPIGVCNADGSPCGHYTPPLPSKKTSQKA